MCYIFTQFQFCFFDINIVLSKHSWKRIVFCPQNCKTEILSPLFQKNGSLPRFLQKANTFSEVLCLNLNQRPKSWSCIHKLVFLHLHCYGFFYRNVHYEAFHKKSYHFMGSSQSWRAKERTLEIFASNYKSYTSTANCTGYGTFLWNSGKYCWWCSVVMLEIVFVTEVGWTPSELW